MEFTKILLLSETYRRTIGDPLETNMPNRRPTGLIGYLSGPRRVDMLHQKPISNRHAPLETDMPYRQGTTTHGRPTCI